MLSAHQPLIKRRARNNLAGAVLLIITAFFIHARGEEPAPAKAPTPADLVKQGRQLFGEGRYADALKAFEKSLDATPSNKETRFLAATAAYWARKPARALEYWNRLYDLAARGSNDEWEIEKNRVMTLSALGQFEASEMAVDRMREIRAGAKSSTAVAAKGFVRENFFGKNMRAGCWESFDERGDAPALWTISVQRDVDPPASSGAQKPQAPAQPAVKTIATLAVEIAALPGGGTGFVFSEETEEATRIYKRWTQRPTYAEFRALALSVLAGSADPLEEKLHKPVVTSLLATGEDDAVPQEIKDMRLDPETENIVFTAWKLKAVHADVTKLARILPGDTAALELYLQEFNAKYPRAAANAGELAELVAAAKPEQVRVACEKLSKLSMRSAYLEFALLTALNTRDSDLPAITMMTFAKSPDFLVRETTGLLLARHAQRHGIEMLFDELLAADARGCELLAGALEELLGHVLDTPPNSKAADVEEKLKDWKRAAGDWRAANLAKLEFNPKPKPGEAIWTTK